MSMIKCPQCGHRISSMAGTCPHCGTRIAGNLAECPGCGRLLTKDSAVCPDCGTVQRARAATDSPLAQQSGTAERTPKAPAQQSGTAARPRKAARKGRKALVTAAAFIVVAALSGGAYYLDAQRRAADSEEKCYRRLSGVSNPEFYRRFLAEYPGSAHREEVARRMQVLQEEKDDWDSTLHRNTREGYMDFVRRHPDAPQRRICEHKADSLDWAAALAQASYEAVSRYIASHPEGRYVGEAAERRAEMAGSKVGQEERAEIAGRLGDFFANAIGRRDTALVAAAIPGTMRTFCGTRDATPAQIAAFGAEKEGRNVAELTYRISGDIALRRVALSDSSLGYAVDFVLEETLRRTDARRAATSKYKGSATIDSNRLITSMTIR